MNQKKHFSELRYRAFLFTRNVILTLSLIMFANFQLYAATDVTAGTSNYNISATSAGGTAFTSANNLILNGWGNPTYTLTANVQCVDLTLSQSVRLSMNGYTLTVTGNLVISDNNTMQIDLGSGGQLLVTGNATIGSSCGITGSGACLFQVGGAALTANYNNTFITLGASGTLKVAGNVTVGSSNTITVGTMEMSGCGQNMDVSSAFSVSTFRQSSSCGTTITRSGGTSTITVTNYDQNHNSVNIKPGSNFSVTTTINASCTRTWDGGGGDNNWSTAANWVGDVAPVAGDDLVFTGSTRTTPYNDFTAGTTFNSISLTGANGASADFTLSGNSFILSGGTTAITNRAGTAGVGGYHLTINNNITFSTAAPTLTLATTTANGVNLAGTVDNGGYTITINNTGSNTNFNLTGNISGSGGLVLNGPATVMISGTNTYSGGTTINGGSVKFNSNQPMGTAGASVIVNGGSLDSYSSDRTLPNYAWTINANFSYAGSNRGLNLGAGSIALNTDITFNVNSNTFTIGGVISGAYNIIKSGNGTLYLSGTNTYSGTTTVNAGVLKIGNSSALGTVAGNTIIATGAALDLNGINYSTAEPITINGTGITSAGAIINSSSTAATFAGLVTLGSATSIIAGTGNITLSHSGTITGATYLLTLGGAKNGAISSIIGNTSGGVTKQDAGIWTLSGANTYTGATTISAGTLKLGAAGVIPDGSAVSVTGTLDMNTFSETVGSITGGGIIDNVSGAGTPTLTCGGDNSSTSFSGIIQNTSGTISLSKTGSGALTLSGANSYSGSTSIGTGGTLKLGAAGVIPDASAVTVTGTLDMNTFSETVGSIAGAGTIDNVSGAGTPTLTCGGDGTSSIFSGVITDASGTLSFIKTGSGALTLSGANTLSGSVSLNVGQLNINNASALGTGTFIIANGTIIDNTSAGSITNSNNNAQTWNGDFTFTGTKALDLGTGSVTMGSSTRNVTGSASTLTIGGVISGGAGVGLTKSGNGTLALGTINSGSYWTGTTTVNAGTLQLGNPGGDHYVSTSWVINSGGTILYTANNVISNSAVITINTGGYFNMNSSYYDAVGYLAGGGNLTNLNSLQLDLPTTGSGSDFSGVISGSGNINIRGQVGSGTQIFSGLNTYTGITCILNGTLSINTIGNVNGGASAIGNPSSSTNGTIGIGSTTTTGTLVYTGTAQTTDRIINLVGTTGGAVIDQSGTGLLKFSSALTATGSGAKTFTLQGSTAGTGEIGGAIVDGASSTVTSVTKSGAGTWTLSGTNTYTGTTTVSAGILQLNNTAALGTNAAGTTVATGAAIDLNGITYATTEALTINSTGISGGGAIINSGGSASYAGAVTLGSDATITTANQITLSGTISPNTYSITKAGTNSLVFTNNTISVKDLTISAGTLVGGSSTINIYGNFTNNGTFTPNTNGVNMDGSGSQAIPATNYNNLTINNSAGATLAGNISVSGTLTMTAGILNTGSYTVDLGATGTLSESHSSATAPDSYITGTVKATRSLMQNVQNTFGGIGVDITDANLSNNSTVVIRSTGTSCTALGHSGLKRYYTITPATDAGLNATFVFHYFDNEIVGTEANLKLFKSYNSRVKWYLQSSSTVNTANNTITQSGISDFSDWTGSDAVGQTLPIELSTFKSSKKGNGIALEWSTASELNNKSFLLERSVDGINWNSVYTCDGAGTSTQEHRYSFIDINPINGINYYRLKQTDVDGTSSYSSITSQIVKSDSLGVIIYPMPGHYNEINIQLKNTIPNESVSITILNTIGKMITTGEIEIVSDLTVFKISDFYNLVPGTYFVSIVTNSFSTTKKIEVLP